MELERWHKVDNILQAALALNPAERSLFVDSACDGDEALRDEVISLLSLDEEGLSIIDSPALEAAACVLGAGQPDLTEGQFVGHFRVLSLLGEGGMGEVYLAEDTKLGRRIALKLLPVDFSRDRDRIRRFQQEARAASALNHPYIVTIHETGEFQDRHFIATEFIEGETLRRRMRRTAFNLSETLDIAIQVAGALGAAHQAGIVHRDIKTENIMLRPDGYVKVLDFGLAKLTEQSAGAGGREPASDDADTTPGLLMGTVKYMSPEQARGLSLDARSDIFSLGVVIYEMLAGRLPFEGDTNSDVIAALLKEEPLPLSRFVPELPVEFEHIVSRALAKKRRERYQTTDDLLEALKELRRELEVEHTLGSIKRSQSGEGISSLAAQALRSAASTAASSPSITLQVVTLVTRHKLQTGAAFLTAIVAAGGFFYSSNRGGRARRAFQEVKMSQIVESDKSQYAAVSPDGKYIAHTLPNGSILLRSVDTNSNTVLVPPNDAWSYGITFSRDGNYVYYVQLAMGEQARALYKVAVSGGDPQKVLANVECAITFSPDGARFAFVRNITEEETGLFIANADGTEERLLGMRRSPNFFSPVGPSWAPDGKLIACPTLDEHPDEHPAFMNVAGVSVEDGSEKLLTNGRWAKVLQVAWLADNSGFIMAATEKGEGALLWHVSFPGGEARRITNDPSNYPSDYNSISLTADSRTLVVSRFEKRTNLWISPAGDTSQISQITFGGKHRYKKLAWTPDGKIVFPSDASGDREIWIMEGDGSGQKQLTADGRFNQLPTVSSDGRYIVYTSGRHIWRMNIDGSNPIQLTHGKDDFGPQCSPDGRWVFYMSVASDKTTIWETPIDGGEPDQFTKVVSTDPVMSPDGTLVTCWWWSPPQSPAKIAVIPSAGGRPIKFLDALPGAELPMRWTSDGQSLIYSVKRKSTSNIWSQPLAGGQPRQLTDFKSEAIEGFDWSRDDRLLLSRGFTAREIVLIQDISR
jgi:eukaryotic-like serine/threonine-protein kinase